jgi:hypothetical protein
MLMKKSSLKLLKPELITGLLHSGRGNENHPATKLEFYPKHPEIQRQKWTTPKRLVCGVCVSIENRVEMERERTVIDYHVGNQ